MNCSKCDCYFPSTEKICPVCGGVKFNSKLLNYTSVIFGATIFFLLLCLLSPLIGFIVIPILLVIVLSDFNKNYSNALGNGGYFLTEKTLKFKEKINHKASGLTCLPHEKIGSVKFTENINKTNGIDIFSHLYSGNENDFNDSISDFKDSLGIVWTEDPLDIEFSYIDSSGNRTRRCILLHEVLINKNSDPYFYGLCFDVGDNRLFKVDRITSKIKHKSSRYEVSEFFDEVLELGGVY